MTTLAQSTPYSIGNVANMRISGAELSAWLTTVGLLKTADTGQADWATATLPGSGGLLIGYETRVNPDASWVCKLEWFTGANASTAYSFYLTVGTGTDGAGNITGIFYARTQIRSIGTTTVGTNCPTYICCTNDFFGICYKYRAQSGADAGGPPCGMSFSVEKLVDSSGVPSGLGYRVTYSTTGVGNSMSRTCRTSAPAQTFADSLSYCLVAGNVTSSSVGADRQVFLHQMPTPRVVFSNYICTIITSELIIATTFTATLVGATPRTYLSLGSGFGAGNSAVEGSSLTWGTAMLWE